MFRNSFRATLRTAIILVTLMTAVTSACQKSLASEPSIRNVEYASVDGVPLLLDLYLPDADDADGDSANPTILSPAIIWVHGGAWRAGSKDNMPLGRLLQEGFAVASVDYRLSPVAKFPAQVHDIKAAIRFLRANRTKYHLDGDNFVIAGASAGGHLAALVGVTNGHPQLKGTVGTHLSESSDVQKIVSFYGAANLQSILSQSTPHGLSVRIPALQLLLGGQPNEQPELAKLASPVDHVDTDDPPLLLIHGDADPQMPYQQSVELSRKYKNAGRSVHLFTVPGGVHGGAGFFEDDVVKRVAGWLKNGNWE
ncbi:MAG: alpha/beta hydrolase [Planctomycetaceae bacterium]|nr:alpha/beta hydrolase [Planctomycetaceae bacterium]